MIATQIEPPKTLKANVWLGHDVPYWDIELWAIRHHPFYQGEDRIVVEQRELVLVDGELLPITIAVHKGQREVGS